MGPRIGSTIPPQCGNIHFVFWTLPISRCFIVTKFAFTAMFHPAVSVVKHKIPLLNFCKIRQMLILMEEVIVTDSSTRAATSWCRWPSTPSSTICPSSPSSPRSAPTSTPPPPPPTRRWPPPHAALRSWGLHPGISGQSIEIKFKLILNCINWELIQNLKFYIQNYSVLNRFRCLNIYVCNTVCLLFTC